MLRFVAIIALAIFASVALYGVIAPHGLWHESGCLSAIAFNQPCLAASLDGHLKLFSMFGLVLPILLLLAVVLLIFAVSLFSPPPLSYNKIRFWLPEYKKSYLDRFIIWLSRKNKSPTAV